ncbi:hypothetical protein INR49_027484 [Caranx melampygus]|nr:hypothetical protein INR49_027484 [Caranx melampygus]
MENMSDSLCESVPSQNRMPSQRTQLGNGPDSHISIKKAVVVLTRLPEYKISALRPPTPQQFYSEDDLLSSSDSDMQWEPEGDSKDGRVKYKVSFEEKGKSLVSGHHIAFDTTPKLDELYVGARVALQSQDNKLLFQPGVLAELPVRKNHSRFLVFIDDHTPVYVGLPQLHLVCRPLEDVSEDIPESPHKHFIKRYLNDWPYPHLTYYRVGQTVNIELAGAHQKCEVQVVDCSLMQVTFQREPKKTALSSVFKDTPAESGGVSLASFHLKNQLTMEEDQVETTKEELRQWIRERVMKNELISSEGGQVKYKVRFEERGKRLVSAHHIAFDCSSKEQQLFVGARVVIKNQANPPHFHPGFLAEMPSGRNNMRFLVFFDDHSPVYVSLPVIHLVCKPLRNPLDDIENDTHRKFMMAYLDSWPCVPLAQYKEGQLISAEFNGVQQECEVLEADSSLIKVVFKS